MNMEKTGQWQYKTIFFEFHKDGLLGDKYIDDEQVEFVLNEEGAVGWELVTVTMVPEGMITFCKRPLTGSTGTGKPLPTNPAVSVVPGGNAKPAVTATPVKTPEKQFEGLHRPGRTTDGQDTIGDIKIS